MINIAVVEDEREYNIPWAIGTLRCTTFCKRYFDPSPKDRIAVLPKGRAAEYFAALFLYGAPNNALKIAYYKIM